MNPNEQRQSEGRQQFPSFPNDRPEGGQSSIVKQTDLVELYKGWVKYYSNRTGLYSDRLDVAWASLLVDIDRWEEKLRKRENNNLVHCHVDQFRKFVSRAYDALITNSPQVQKADPADVLDFRALVIGVFTAQWSLLQNVAAQRIAYSPYQKGIDELDELANGYYARLYHVFTGKLNPDKLNVKYQQKPFAPFAPPVYLGNVAQLAVFNQRIPLVISIPLGALGVPKNAEQSKEAAIITEEKVEQIRMALPHEVAHAIFAQVPELIQEIKEKLKSDLKAGKLKTKPSTNELSRQEQVLYDMAIEWTGEICADLVGTALIGELYAQSARWTMAGTSSTAGITDETHPPAVLRPIVHLLALSALVTEKERFEKTLRYFEQTVLESASKVTVDFCLDHRFRSVPALMFVRLETVSDILSSLAKRILELPLETLRNDSLGSLLPIIFDAQEADLPFEELKWGEDQEINSEEFVLDFPADIVPSYTTPGIDLLPDIWPINWVLNSIRRKT